MAKMNEKELVYRQVGARIEQIRTALGWTQDELAKRVGGLGRTSITNIEAGKQVITLHELERIAKAFGSSPKHLMRGIWF
jgi:transcriptional regulator with XRE-family HTH domain